MLDVASSPLPEDENTASLQSACHSHLNYTRLRLGIYKPIGAQSSSESSSDDETSENESDEETEDASNEVNNQGKEENTCDAFMSPGKECPKEPLCSICTEKGKVLSMALLEAVSKPPDGKEKQSERCGLQECLKEWDKEK